MVATIRRLPLGDREAFFSDARNGFTAEACLRRALEGLLDLGRLVLARRFGIAAAEYKAIARELGRAEVLADDDVERLVTLAGYRNRMVHFYHEVTPEEIFTVCAEDLDDVDRLADALRTWFESHISDDPVE